MPKPPYHRSRMSEEEKIAARRHAKHLEYLRKSGRPAQCTPEETEEALTYLRTLRNVYGMKTEQMRAQCGLSIATLNDYIRGRRTPAKGSRPVTAILRKDRDAVLAIVPEPPVGRGSLIPIEGSRRRLAALLADGYGYPLLREFLGWCNHQNVWQIIMDDDNRWVTWATMQEIDVVYRKYAGTDPRETVGSSDYSYNRARNTAKRHGFAPSHCWDADTIDNPEAFPEWTGSCGTVSGFRIHYREHLLPVCQPCSTARQIRHHWPRLAELWGIAAPPSIPGMQTPESDVAGIIAALEAGDMSVQSIARDFGVSKRTVIRIRQEVRDGCVRLGNG